MKYKIKQGDTLSELAVKFGTTTEALVKANKIKNPNLIYIDDELTVPDPPVWSLTETIRKWLWG